MTKNKEMKTWVWEDILCDYRCGMAVVKAESKEKAYEAVRNADMLEHNKEKLISHEPRELEDNEFLYVKGGS